MIEDIITGENTRGIDILKNAHKRNFCLEAAEALYNTKRGNIFLLTGFYVNGAGETDGPVGTYFLARALKKMGFEPVIISDRFCNGFFDMSDRFKVIYPEIGLRNHINHYKTLIGQYSPKAVISIERAGRTKSGAYYNMKRKNISLNTAPLDEFLILLKNKGVLTIGIGDGGNEAGLAEFYDVILQKKMPILPTVVGSDYPVLASVSNWGVYGLLGYLSEFNRKNFMPQKTELENYLEYINNLGSVDGITLEKNSTDGFPLETDHDIIADINKEIIIKNQKFI